MITLYKDDGRVHGHVTPQEADTAKQQIAQLKGDPRFLERYASSNPHIRDLAIRELEAWHLQAFGNKPVE
jgi:hypothetical protein